MYAVAVVVFGLGCQTAGTSSPVAGVPAAADTGHSGLAVPVEVRVTVTLDGVPIQGASVLQAGTETRYETDASGVVDVPIDGTIDGDLWVAASFPSAWNAGAAVKGASSVTIGLTTFDPADNPDYTFADPGIDATADSNATQCSHCHLSLHRGWAASPHAASARNPVVHAVYQGFDRDVPDVASCEARGGSWEPAVEPGTSLAIDACHVAEAVSGAGGCADCHAPGIGGADLAGHELLEATGLAYQNGVHCDVCHKVESVDVGEAAGVAGWLNVLRPSDPSPSRLLGPFHPLQFGPYIDVLHPLMGGVQREHLHSADFCGGCHQLDQGVLVEGVELDWLRWPDGTLPVQSTWAEWEDGPMNPAAPCQSCHMPPLPGAGNSADLGNEFDLLPGVATGWYRAPGAVRAHSWVGPRQPESGMLELAALLQVETELTDGELVATVVVQNSGPGHALPTGESLRNLVLRVDAACDGAPLRATGGDVVPVWGGVDGVRTLPAELLVVVGAAAGDRLRLLATVGWVEYQGFGAFGDGRFSAAEKGLPDYAFVGDAEVLAVDAEGRVTLDHPEWVASADTAFWVRAAGVSEVGAVGGLPGFGFARVLVGDDGERMVPHHLAVDVESDNRLLPTDSFTTEHRFEVACASPTVTATLRYRAVPWGQAQRYGWVVEDRVMATVTR
ncbi:MAG: hypothetical protein EXR71_09225 [Myxococcales bacterium]|nr:hypothetical protein [Myxococcales bacterium]